jgi:CheY-like chemotaxis protein
MTKILIADDNENIREVMVDALKMKGYETIAVNDGVEVIRVLQKETVDLIILDIIMPNKEGLETLMEVKAINADIKVMAITGKTYITGYDNLFAAKAFGADSTMRKPFHIDSLIEAVETTLKS